MPKLNQDGLIPVAIRLDFPGLTDGDGGKHEDFDLTSQVKIAMSDVLANRGKHDLADRCRNYAGELWAMFHDESIGLLGTDVPRIALIFDQFEEVFTRGSRIPSAVSALMSQIAGLVENRPSPELARRIDHDETFKTSFNFDAQPVKVVIVLREDFLSRLERHRREMPSMMDNRMELRPLSGPQALEAVMKPGRLVSQNSPLVNEEVAEAIVRAVADVEDDVPLEKIDAVPPLLSLMCRELNNRRIVEEMDTIQSSLLEGNSDRILREFYQSCLQDMPRIVQVLVEERLLSPDGLRESVTRGTVIQELRSSGADKPEALIDELVKRRLIHEEERRNVVRLELTHDVLCDVVSQSRDKRKQEEAKRAAEEEQARQKELRIRSRRIAIAMSVLAVLAAAGALFGWINLGKIQRAHGDLGMLREEKQLAESIIAESKQQKAKLEEDLKKLDDEKKKAAGDLSKTRDALEVAAQSLKDAEGHLVETEEKLDAETKRANEVLAFLQSEEAHEELSKRRPDGLAIVEQIKSKVTKLFPNVSNSAEYLERDIEVYRKLGEGAIDGREYTLDVALQHFETAKKAVSQLQEQEPDKKDTLEIERDLEVRIGEILLLKGQPIKALEEISALHGVSPEAFRGAFQSWPSTVSEKGRGVPMEFRIRIASGDLFYQLGDEKRSVLEVERAAEVLNSINQEEGSIEWARSTIALAGRQLRNLQAESDLVDTIDFNAINQAISILWPDRTRRGEVVDFCLQLGRHFLENGDMQKAISLPHVVYPKEMDLDGAVGRPQGGAGVGANVEEESAEVSTLALDRVIEDAVLVADLFTESVLAQINLAQALETKWQIQRQRAISSSATDIKAAVRESIPLLESAYRTLNELHENDPERLGLSLLLAKVSVSLGIVESDSQDHAEASEHLRKALQFDREILDRGGRGALALPIREKATKALLQARLYHFYSVMGRGSPLDESMFYDDEVDYLGEEGLVDRATIRREIQRYREVYPIQRWEIVEIKSMEEQEDGTFVISASFRYWVSKDTPFDGKRWDKTKATEVLFRITDKFQPVIARIKVSG